MSLLIETPDILARITDEAHDPKLAGFIGSGSGFGKVHNPGHTTPNLGAFLLGLRTSIDRQYSGGGSRMAVGTNRIPDTANGSVSHVILNDDAESVLQRYGKRDSRTRQPSFFSAWANAEQIPGMRNGPEHGFLLYVSALSGVSVETLQMLADADSDLRRAYNEANR